MNRPAAAATLGMALGLVAVAVFAGSLPATRLAVASLDANFVTAARAAIAGLIALPTLVFSRRAPRRRDLPKLGLCALCLVAGFPAFTALALRSLPASHGGAVLGAMPLATAAFAALVDRDRPSRAFWLCSGLGAALVVGFALSRGGGALQPGDALLFGGVACAACGYTWSAQLSRRLSSPETISWIVVLALPVSLPLSLVWRPADLRRRRAARLGEPRLPRRDVDVFRLFLPGAPAWRWAAWRASARSSLLQPFLTFAIAAVGSANGSTPRRRSRRCSSSPSSWPAGGRASSSCERRRRKREGPERIRAAPKSGPSSGRTSKRTLRRPSRHFPYARDSDRVLMRLNPGQDVAALDPRADSLILAPPAGRTAVAFGRRKVRAPCGHGAG